jgi:hypothetical protein
MWFDFGHLLCSCTQWLIARLWWLGLLINLNFLSKLVLLVLLLLVLLLLLLALLEFCLLLQMLLVGVMSRWRCWSISIPSVMIGVRHFIAMQCRWMVWNVPYNLVTVIFYFYIYCLWCWMDVGFQAHQNSLIPFNFNFSFDDFLGLIHCNTDLTNPTNSLWFLLFISVSLCLAFRS